MSNVHPIHLRFGEELVEGTLRAVERSSNSEAPCQLELWFAGKLVIGSGPDFFEALRGIRRTLEQEGIFPLVYGASKNVWPSGMARSMSAGLSAYRMTKGKQALTEDLVKILESGPDVEPSTIAEQEQYKNEWFASLGAGT